MEFLLFTFMLASGMIGYWMGYDHGKWTGLAERDKLWDQFHGINRNRPPVSSSQENPE